MPGMYESDQVIKVQQVGGIHNVESMETPFLRLLPNGGTPKQMLDEWAVEGYDDTPLGGVVDGSDVTEFSSQVRHRLQNYAMWQRESWMVGKLATLTHVAGMGKTEVARQKRIALLKLKKKVERTALSNLDALAEAKPATAYRTRGALMWLQPTAQSLFPVPDGFRPGAEYAGDLADLTPSAFEALLENASVERGGPVSLTGHVGIKLKRHMSMWVQRDTEAGSGDIARLAYNLSAADKALIEVVNRFEFDAGSVYNFLNYNIAHDTSTGASTDYSARSGVYVDPKMWAFAALQGYQVADLKDQGGGPRGYADVVYTIRCHNPRGQFRVLTDS